MARNSKDFLTQKVMPLDDTDRDIWEIISHNTIPRLNKVLAVICAFLNLIFPGLGTLVAACAASDTTPKIQLFIALLQFLTSVLIVGWIWAIYWGYLFCHKAFLDTAQVT